MDETLHLEDLPFEVISLILSHLPLNSLIPATFLSRTFHFVASSPTTTPFHGPISAILSRGTPYPRELETLGTYSHVPRSVFVQVLVKADAGWILDRMVIPPGITPGQWEHIFRARFLPSWTRYKHTTDTYRTAFLQTLRALTHRTTGCTHAESWTRFIILHRNGTASLNRIYSRTFDPGVIYEEIRRQNGLMGLRQEVREVVRLQDVRVLVYGTLASPRSLFVNPNAYTILHPPGLEEITAQDVPDSSDSRIGVLVPPPDERPTDDTPPPAMNAVQESTMGVGQPTTTSGRGFTRTRSLSFGRHGAHAQQAPASETPSGGGGAISSLVNRLRGTTISRPDGSAGGGDGGERATVAGGRTAGGGRGRRTSWLGRTRSREDLSSGSGGRGVLSRTTTRAGGAGITAPVEEPIRRNEDVAPAQANSAVQSPNTAPPKPAAVTPFSVPSTQSLTYSPITQPLPAQSHALYPNWTPSKTDGPARDTRHGRLVAREAQKYLAAAVPVGTEWDDTHGWRTWIGPVLIIAQLCRASQPQDPTVTPDGPVPPVSLGPPGMYASFDWEDLDALFPWLELRESENGNDVGAGTHRAGLGFAR